MANSEPIQYSSMLRRRICKKVKMYAIGNSNRKLKDVAIDLINESHLSWEIIADGCYLSKATIKNLANEVTKNPQSETIERIFRYFEVSVNFKGEVVKAQFVNVAKE